MRWQEAWRGCRLRRTRGIGQPGVPLYGTYVEKGRKQSTKKERTGALEITHMTGNLKYAQI